MRNITKQIAAFALLALSVSSACAQSVNGGAGQTINGAPVGGGSSCTFGTTAGTCAQGNDSRITGAVQTTRTISAGTGLSGGGDLSANRTFAISETLGNSGAAITGTTYTIDTTNDAAKQLLFTGSSNSAWTLGTPVSGVGFDVVNRGTADITITATGNIDGASTAVVKAGFWAHIFAQGASTWWTEPAVSVSGVTAGTYGDATHCAYVTVDAYGRVTSASQSTSCPGGGSSSFANNWVANNWYPVSRGTVGTGVNVGATTTYWQSRYFDKALTISQVHVRISATSASQNAAIAIYAADATTGLPTGSALCSVNTLSTTTGTDVSGNCSAALSAGKFYWFGFQVSDATATVISMAAGQVSNSNYEIGTSGANVSGNTTNATMAYTTTGGTFGTWPTTPTITQTAITTNLIPFINFKVGSIP